MRAARSAAGSSAAPSRSAARASVSSASECSVSSSPRRSSTQRPVSSGSSGRSSRSSAARARPAARSGSPAPSAASAVGRRRARLLDVERDAGQREPQAAAALDRLGPERAPHAREQRGEPGVGRARRAVVPDDVDQLVAAHLALAVERQAREQQPPLAARQVSLDPAPVDLDGEGAHSSIRVGTGCRRA